MSFKAVENRLGLYCVVLIPELDKVFLMNIHKFVGQSAIVLAFPISLILECLTSCSRFVLCLAVASQSSVFVTNPIP